MLWADSPLVNKFLAKKLSTMWALLRVLGHHSKTKSMPLVYSIKRLG